MTQAVLLGVTTDEYAEFQALFNGLMEDGNEHFDSKECADLFEGNRFCVKSCPECLKDASEKTLTLRVQMQDVTKPPMWRELKIPADFTFYQLHRAIQKVCGFENAHLWCFQSNNTYNHELSIGLPTDSYEMGLEDCTHDARETGITAFLSKKGQKLVYVYDFGDDWRFSINVINVSSRDGEVAECTRWKSDMQPIEDCGGVWSYLNMRLAWKEQDSLTKSQKKELANALGYDSFDDLKYVLKNNLFDPEAVNESLAEI